MSAGPIPEPAAGPGRAEPRVPPHRRSAGSLALPPPPPPRPGLRALGTTARSVKAVATGGRGGIPVENGDANGRTGGRQQRFSASRSRFFSSARPKPLQNGAPRPPPAFGAFSFPPRRDQPPSLLGAALPLLAVAPLGGPAWLGLAWQLLPPAGRGPPPAPATPGAGWGPPRHTGARQFAEQPRRGRSLPAPLPSSYRLLPFLLLPFLLLLLSGLPRPTSAARQPDRRNRASGGRSGSGGAGTGPEIGRGGRDAALEN